ncbi:MAG: lysophospholipase [Caldilineaceae bacterium]|nr:lysophospholipase [Caldilineaceae bacterium]MDE0340342.1 lysophospholipase [Caldilineaceae bacterium]
MERRPTEAKKKQADIADYSYEGSEYQGNFKSNWLQIPDSSKRGNIQYCRSEEECTISDLLAPARSPYVGFKHSTGYLRSETGLPIFYSQWLPSRKARGVVLVLHGLGEHSGRYRHLVGAFLKAGYSVYAHDHQGFGRSGGPRCYVQGFHDYLSDISQVVSLARQRSPGLPCCLYGHSMGGLIGLQYLMDVPGAFDFCVIASPSLRSQDLSPFNRLLKRILESVHRVRPQLTFRQRGSLDTLSRDWEEVQLAVRDSLGVPLRSARWVVEFFEAMQEVSDRANEIRLPILMMQGLADAVVVPSATQEFFAHVGSTDKSLCLFEGYYHELHNDLGREKPIGAALNWLNARCPAIE